MTIVIGKLVKQGPRYMVNLPSKKGSANHSIPEPAKQFSDADAADGIEVEVEKDERNRIIRVTIPGKATVQPVVTPVSSSKNWSRDSRQHKSRQDDRGFGIQQADRSKLAKAKPSVLGEPFHNPYTFIPFEPTLLRDRDDPTFHSADEVANSGRYSGILRLRVTTLSPLVSCNPEARDNSAQHKEHSALTIGDDVIVPATGVRGALRTLLTIITGGTLGYMNSDEILCQGRDLNLGPKGTNSPAGTPVELFLAEVITAGTSRRPGRVRLGRSKVKLVSAEELENKFSSLKDFRTADSPRLWVELNASGGVHQVVQSNNSPSNTAGRLKLSGRPVNRKGKREAVFFPTSVEIELPSSMWTEYAERHKFGDRPTLKNGDLVWLMPSNPTATELKTASDVSSIQWARWGRKGQKLVDVINQHHKHVLPDNSQTDGKVDCVTDLFGQIPIQRASAPAFAARVMPDNLVFYGAKKRVKTETLAPLAQPHPGCIAFYRQSANPDTISIADPLRGYKVYRTTDETGANAPWLFDNQGIYGDSGELLDPRSNLNKTCELLPMGESGCVNLSFTALSKFELALLMQACSVAWRLGGGKPLGLGRCTVAITDLMDELGAPMGIEKWTSQRQADGTLVFDGWQEEVEKYSQRVASWQASQQPVSKLRYPRAVVDTNYKKSRGGHVWFSRNSQPRAGDKDGQKKPGLNPIYIDGKLLKDVQQSGSKFDPSEPMIAAQPLPPLNPANPSDDLLFGYDLYPTEVETRQRPTRVVFSNLEPFDASKHVTGREKSSGNHGKGKEFREKNKKRDA